MIDQGTNSNVLGFSYVNDPLDRIFINAEFIPDDFSPDEREYEGYAQQQYYVNLIADTMRHEAIHALGSPDDYFYLRVDTEGNLEDVESSIARIEYHILTGNMLSEKFVYLCKTYFMTNPVYKAYNIESLLIPSTLYQIFKRDDYLRMIFLINNPDTLSLIIRDLAKRSKFPHG
ncbi:MAG: hypothetical protein ACMZI0_11840 [Symbiopectobacterium sp.]|uniref:hypothetical protein n=1 Tax=Symbiopectobacterium sp. TaxID=2952789 RepID=UPI0039EBCC38